MADADDTNELLTIEVDTDDYAETAAGDTSSVPRTFLSEADFHAQRASYQAKIDTGNNLEELYGAVPYLRPPPTEDDVQENEEGEEAQELTKRIRLSKKEVQLLGYAVGEMYWDKQYAQILGLVQRVEDVVEVEFSKGLGESLKRWKEKCSAKLAAGSPVRADEVGG